jgi:hypothetical protein
MGSAHPQRVAGGGAGVERKGVQHQVGQLETRQVLGRRHTRRKDQPLWRHTVGIGGAQHVLARGVVVGQQPQHAAGHRRRMRIQAANISAVNLWLLLNEQKTKASSGRP